jgi:hypothetical protein
MDGGWGARILRAARLFGTKTYLVQITVEHGEDLMTDSADPDPENDLARMRFVFSQWTLICIIVIAVSLLLTMFVLIVSVEEYRRQLISYTFAHAPATLGIPFCAGTAMFVVLILRATQGPAEFEGLGFKFRGASGPIVMWVLCFLALVAATKLLWI